MTHQEPRKVTKRVPLLDATGRLDPSTLPAALEAALTELHAQVAELHARVAALEAGRVDAR